MTDDPNPNSIPLPRRGGRTFAFFVGLAILVVAGMWSFQKFIAQPSISPIERFAEALGSVTKEKVKVTGRTVTLERSETRELAVVQRKVQSMVKYETNWLGSNKVIVVQGDFLVKAGFDLTEFEGFEVSGSEVVGQWPRAKVLSVEQLDHRIFFSQSGVVNKLTGEDYEAVANLLQQQARKDAIERSDVIEEAERVLYRRLNDLGGGLFQEIP